MPKTKKEPKTATPRQEAPIPVDANEPPSPEGLQATLRILTGLEQLVNTAPVTLSQAPLLAECDAFVKDLKGQVIKQLEPFMPKQGANAEAQN